MADSQFVGRWVGETMSYDSPAHIWDITQRGRTLFIRTRWENELGTTALIGYLKDDDKTFTLKGKREFTARLADPQHFWIPEWDTNDIRGGEGPNYDVVFSRPGLAELSAKEVWRKVKS